MLLSAEIDMVADYTYADNDRINTTARARILIRGREFFNSEGHTGKRRIERSGTPGQTAYNIDRWPRRNAQHAVNSSHDGSGKLNRRPSTFLADFNHFLVLVGPIVFQNLVIIGTADIADVQHQAPLF